MMNKQYISDEIDLSMLTTYQAGIVQASAHRNLQKTCDDILKQFDITTMQWLLLGTIHTAKGESLRLTDVASMTGTGLPYITNTLNDLEAKGIITRRVNRLDSRSKIIVLSDSFAEKFNHIERTLRAHLRERLYENISDTDFKAYVKVLYQLANNKDLSQGKTKLSKQDSKGGGVQNG
jgi:DNA-binding MarR family transcriptional regulator